MSVPCACPGGGSGAQVCGGDRTYGACSCSGDGGIVHLDGTVPSGDGGGRFDGGDRPDVRPSTDGGPCSASYFTGFDHCTNAADYTAVMRTDYGSTMDQSASDLAGACGRSMCLAMIGTPGFAGCVADCVSTMSGFAISSACATCYGASVACSADHCLTVCLSGGSACDACRYGDNACGIDCAQIFYDCSGLAE
jgi:hypothetical protein